MKKTIHLEWGHHDNYKKRLLFSFITRISRVNYRFLFAINKSLSVLFDLQTKVILHGNIFKMKTGDQETDVWATSNHSFVVREFKVSKIDDSYMQRNSNIIDFNSVESLLVALKKTLITAISVEIRGIQTVTICDAKREFVLQYHFAPYYLPDHDVQGKCLCVSFLLIPIHLRRKGCAFNICTLLQSMSVANRCAFSMGPTLTEESDLLCKKLGCKRRTIFDWYWLSPKFKIIRLGRASQ